MPSIPDKIASNFIDGALDLEGLTRRYQGETLDMLKELANSIDYQLTNGSSLAPVRTQFKRQRLEQLLAQVKKTIDVAYKKIAKEQQSMLTSLATLASRRAVDATNVAIGVDLLSVGLTVEQAAALAGDVMIDGARSLDWWMKQNTDLQFAFQNQIRQGVARGETVQEIRNRIMGDASTRQLPGIGVANKDLRGLSKDERDIILKARRNAASLVRSSVQAVNNQAHLDTFKANNDVVKGLIWLSTLDQRTTITCMALDKLTWEYDVAGNLTPVGHNKIFPGPTAHWGCRSTQIPWLRPWKELSKNKDFAEAMDNVPEGQRASMGGPVSNALDYQGWFDAQGEARQKAILGQGRYDLYKEGGLDFKDLINAHGEPLTIKELEAIIKGGVAQAPVPVKIDPNRQGASPWSMEWHDASWSQDWLKELINTFPDPGKDPGGAMEGAYFQGTLNGDVGSINMGTYKPNDGRGPWTWRHEYGHHIDDRLGHEALRKAGQKAFPAPDSVPSTQTPWSTSISSSPEGRATVDKDRKLYSKAKNIRGAGLNAVADSMNEKARNIINEAYDKDPSLSNRDIIKAWFKTKDDGFSKLALKLMDHDPTLTGIQLLKASLANEPAYILDAVGQFLDKGSRYLEDLVGSLTKNKIGFGHADSYYKKHWARQNQEMFANVLALADLGPLGEDIIKYFCPNFGEWALALLKGRL